MPRHAHGREIPNRSSAGGRASHRRRRRRRAPRTLLAVCATVLAAGAGGVFSGVLPLPPGVPASLVVAGDPAGRHPVARPTAPLVDPAGNSRPGGPASTAPASHRPTAAPSSTARVTARPSATGSPTPSGSPSSTPQAPVPAPTSASPSPSDTGAPGAGAGTGAVANDQGEILALVNAQRAQHGCGALTRSQPLTDLAENFSTEMAARHFFDHTDPDGKSPWDRARTLGVTNLGGENIAMGQQSPQEVMTAWMNSAGHRANILNCSYHSLGVGVYVGSGGGPWWTQDFGF